MPHYRYLEAKKACEGEVQTKTTLPYSMERKDFVTLFDVMNGACLKVESKYEALKFSSKNSTLLMKIIV
jgi:hypothetical protein